MLIAVYDFFILYTNIPHNKLKNGTKNLNKKKKKKLSKRECRNKEVNIDSQYLLWIKYFANISLFSTFLQKQQQTSSKVFNCHESQLYIYTFTCCIVCSCCFWGFFCLLVCLYFVRLCYYCLCIIYLCFYTFVLIYYIPIGCRLQFCTI